MMAYTDDQQETIRNFLIQEVEACMPEMGGFQYYDGDSTSEVAPEIADMAIDVLGYEFCDNYVSVVRNIIGHHGMEPQNLLGCFLRLRGQMQETNYLQDNYLH